MCETKRNLQGGMDDSIWPDNQNLSRPVLLKFWAPEKHSCRCNGNCTNCPCS